jgi:hypothetical protein
LFGCGYPARNNVGKGKYQTPKDKKAVSIAAPDPSLLRMTSKKHHDSNKYETLKRIIL